MAPKMLSFSSDRVLIRPVLLVLHKLRFVAAIVTCITVLLRKSTVLLIKHGIVVFTAQICLLIFPL